ncbi:MAG: flagellar motor switch phosphatase FliY [Eubacteriales bacterium]|nr:flagellar motor switch phosphatase FliY [Eubacteriales bacterium]
MSNVENVYNLTEMEIDVIGEVMNISMGAAATAMSTILDKKVSITTPRVKTQLTDEFEFSNMEPALGVLIKYIDGIAGTNILILKEDDVKKILGHLLSMEPSEIVELDEISISAICEIMNQMMGSAASALASFLGQVVNISPPDILDTTGNLKDILSENGDSLVVIEFKLSIDGLVESEFISLMQPQLAKEIVKMSYGTSDIADEEVTMIDMPSEQMLTVPLEQAAPAELRKAPVSEPHPAAGETVTEASSAIPVQEMPASAEIPTGMIQQAEQAARPPQPLKGQVYAEPYGYKPLVNEKKSDMDIDENNLELLMSVPIQITVELGKTRKKIKDIAELAVGNIVELNRQAGDQVDVVANGRPIAKGDVVVVDDNYSVRITEIIKAKDIMLEIK